MRRLLSPAPAQQAAGQCACDKRRRAHSEGVARFCSALGGGGARDLDAQPSDATVNLSSTDSGETRSALKALRARWPGEKLYVVCDNFSPHKHPDVRAWCAANQVELVFLPTYGSWLNWIEAEFAALRYFALNGTDHRSHTEQNALRSLLTSGGEMVRHLLT